MGGLLLKIIPLDLAATLSPGILALAIVLLGSKNYPKIKTLALFLGILVVGIIIAILGFTLGKNTTNNYQQTQLSAIVDLIVGIIFFILALNIIFSKERKRRIKDDDNPHIFKWLLIGIIIAATNLDALFLSFTADKEVGESNINDLMKTILLVINLFFFTLPITLPGFFYLLMPDLASRILTKINQFVLKYSRFVLAFIFIIFGILLLFKGIKFFV